MKNKLLVPIVAALAILFSVLGANTASAYSNEVQKDESDIVKLSTDTYSVETSKGVVLVDFWASWCGPCRKMNPILEAVAKEHKGIAKVAKLNIDDNKDLAINLKVSSIPTIIVYKDGKEVDRIIGVVTQDHLNKVIAAQSTAAKK